MQPSRYLLGSLTWTIILSIPALSFYCALSRSAVPPINPIKSFPKVVRFLPRNALSHSEDVADPAEVGDRSKDFQCSYRNSEWSEKKRVWGVLCLTGDSDFGESHSSVSLHLKTVVHGFWWILFNLEGNHVTIISFEHQNNMPVNIFLNCPMRVALSRLFYVDVPKTTPFSATWYVRLWSHTNYIFLLEVYNLNLINHILEFLSQFIVQNESGLN